MSPRRQPGPSAVESTNVRFKLLKGALGLLVRVAPQMAAAVAERMFFTPPRPRRSRGQVLLNQAEAFRVIVDGRPVAAWRWGRGPTIVLLHGWGGRAAQLTSFVPPLLAHGFSVVAIDAPGHGSSGRGLSSAPQFARALRAVAEVTGPLHGVVAHSLGAAATALALRDGLTAARVVFLGAAADPPSWALRFANLLRLPPDVVEAMRARSERRLGLRWEELHIPTLGADSEAALLVVHDRDDAEVELEDAAAIVAAWPQAGLMETTGLGHTRLLRDREVVARTVDFLAEDVATVCECGAPALDAGDCESCQVERELFDRELRWASL